MALALTKAMIDDEYAELAYEQRLKAAVYFTVVQICKQVELDTGTTINKQVTATIAELTCKQFENFATDLELFARHAKRTTVTTDDVKLLVRKTPSLVQHLNDLIEVQPTKTGDGNRGKKKTSNNKLKKAVILVDKDTEQFNMDTDNLANNEIKLCKQ